MSWESNRDKGKPTEQYRRRNHLRRLRDSLKENEPIRKLRWDLVDGYEEEVDRVPEEDS